MPDLKSGMPPEAEEHLLACTDLIGRTGAEQFQLRYSDSEKPVVWMALAGYDNPKGNQARGTKTIWQVAGGMNPVQAAYRLAEQLIDGGECQHCHRPTGVNNDWTGEQPFNEAICWYLYDPETKKFRRSCE